jgi:hypothetical protein
LSIESLSFLLEDLPTDVFVFADAVRVKLPPTSFTALYKLRGIVLLNLHSVLTIDFLNVPLLEGVALTLPVVVLLFVVVLLPVVVLLTIVLLSGGLDPLLRFRIVLFSAWLLSLLWVFISFGVVVVSTGLAWLIIVLRVVLLHLLIDIFVGSAFIVTWWVVVVLIVIGRN